MVKLPKSIIKKFGITKRAWAEFRKTRGSKVSRPAKRAKRAKRRKSSAVTVESKSGGHPAKHKHGGTKMAKRRKKSVRHRARRAGRRFGAAMGTKPGQVVVAAVTAAAGGVATSMIVNKAPVLKDQGRAAKALIQGGIGLAAILFIRNKHVKSLGAGAVIAAAMGVAREFLKVEPLAGPSAGSRTLTPSEMARVTGGMNMPLPGGMNAPLGSAPANSGFGRGGFGS